MSFNGRIVESTPFENRLFQEISKLGFDTAKNGTEHTHPDFVNRLRQSDDQSSLAIRFQPDGVACIGEIPRSFYVEAKAAKHIEKLAWEQYWKLYEAGNMLAIVFGKLRWGWNFIENIRLVPAVETVAQFPPTKRFPIVDGWITPRASERWHRIVRSNNPQASGTPYREIDPTSLLRWGSFKHVVLERLADRGLEAVG